MESIKTIEKIRGRVSEIQKMHVSLQEECNKITRNHESKTNDAILRVIDILDFVESLQNQNNQIAETADSLISKKLQRRLKELLAFWNVHEISSHSGRIEADKMRVVETQACDDMNISGEILTIIRKGYRHGVKIIRPMDVIGRKFLRKIQK